MDSRLDEAKARGQVVGASITRRGEQDKDVAYQWPMLVSMGMETGTMVPGPGRAENRPAGTPVGRTGIDTLGENIDAVLIDRVNINGHKLRRDAHRAYFCGVSKKIGCTIMQGSIDHSP